MPIYGMFIATISSHVSFDPDSILLDDEADRTVAAVKSVLDRFPCQLTVEGHAAKEEQRRGKWLSKRRAQLVRDRLIELGVEPERIDIAVVGVDPIRPARAFPDSPHERVVTFDLYQQGAERSDCPG